MISTLPKAPTVASIPNASTPQRKVPVSSSIVETSLMNLSPANRPFMGEAGSTMVTPLKESASLPPSLPHLSCKDVSAAQLNYLSDKTSGSKNSAFASTYANTPVQGHIFGSNVTDTVYVHNSSCNDEVQTTTLGNNTPTATIDDMGFKRIANPYGNKEPKINNNVRISRTIKAMPSRDRYPDKACLRCAYINTPNEQTIIFFLTKRFKSILGAKFYFQGNGK
jgi:hypothetical protein